MNIFYSHRPKAGVSVGAIKKDDYLHIAFALVNDGISRNGILWSERHDTFSRPKARAIINGRIESLLAGNSLPLAITLKTDMSARQFMMKFRETFKPTVDETDDFLSQTLSFGLVDNTIDVRVRPTADDILNRLKNLALEIIANAGTSI